MPRRCCICGVFDSWLCPTCARQVRLAKNQRCIVCNKKAAGGILHTQCRTRSTLDGMIAVCEFAQIQPLIHNYKYGLIKELAEPLAETLLRYLDVKALKDFVSKKTLVPVPLHKSRLRFRGFNQSELLAQKLNESLNAKLDTQLIARIKKTNPQVKQNREKREKNIKNAFAIVSPAADGKDILLIDDVATTGTTLNECARVLKQAGANSVWALVLAHD